MWYGAPELRMLDAVTGFLLVGLGFGARMRRPASGTGLILAAAGAAWFAGSLTSSALYLHRGVLAHLVLAYPDGKLTSSRERMAVAAAYAYGAAYPVSGSAYATIPFALGLVSISAGRYIAARGIRRRRGLAPLAGALALASVMLLAVADHLFELSSGRAVLWAYEIVVCLVGVGLVGDLLWGGWAAAVVSGVVVDLG